MSDSYEIDYPARLREAVVQMLRRLLGEVAEDGLPGDHHLYLTFRTDLPEVEMPATLWQRFPEEMTVVLQHQFWDLVADEEAMSVTLKFDGKPQRLMFPWAALVAFADPTAKFGLRLGASIVDEADGSDVEQGSDAGSGGLDEGGEVVSLDDFRKR